MPTNLTSQKVKDTFDQILHIDGGPEAAEKTVYSGTGVATALKVGTGSASVDNVQLDGNTIRTLDTNGSLTLAPNGTGSVAIAKAAITGGTISGITDLAVADGGTGASDASGARTNLGLGTMATQAASAVAITGGTISDVDISGLVVDGFVFVGEKADLPTPSGGVITLLANYTYMFTGTVDLTGDRLVAAQNTTILGGSSENSRIKSTGLVGTALISSAWSLPMRNITIEADVALALDATANADQALDWMGVNFTNTTTIGTIKTYANVIWTDCAVLNSAGLTFDGTIGTIGFNTCLFDASAAGTVLTIPATATVSRRFRIVYSAFVVGGGETGINLNASATIPAEAYILDSVSFSGGGTYTTGVAYSDTKALFTSCRGVPNSPPVGFMTMQANATATTVSVQSTYYKVAGTTSLSSVSRKFTHASNKLTYEGALTRDFRITAVATATSGNGQELGLRFAKNGTTLSESTSISTTSGTGKAENLVAQVVVQLVTSDYIEVFVSNETAVADITVTYLSVAADALN